MMAHGLDQSSEGLKDRAVNFKGHIDAQDGESDHRTARSVLFKLDQGVFLCLCDLGVG